MFSDKTGTLTRNVMEFKRCTVGGIAYGPGQMAEQQDEVPRQPRPDTYPQFAVSAPSLCPHHSQVAVFPLLPVLVLSDCVE